MAVHSDPNAGRKIGELMLGDARVQVALVSPANRPYIGEIHLWCVTGSATLSLYFSEEQALELGSLLGEARELVRDRGQVEQDVPF